MELYRLSDVQYCPKTAGSECKVLHNPFKIFLGYTENFCFDYLL